MSFLFFKRPDILFQQWRQKIIPSTRQPIEVISNLLNYQVTKMVIVEIVYFYAHINQDQESPDNYL